MLIGPARRDADAADVDNPLHSLTVPPASLLRSRRLLALSSVVHPCHSNHASCNLSNLLDSWTDFFLLAAADFILLERSGFSMTAASVGLIEPRHRLFGKDCAYCLGPPGRKWCANESYSHAW